MIVLAVDYGERRTGIAVSDALGITAQGLDTIETKDENKLPSLVAETAFSRKAERIVIGLPLNMDGSESEKSVKVRDFGSKLKELTGLPVFFMDERMTSSQAHKVLHELEKKTRGNKELIDKISATLILQDYLKTI